MLNSNHLKYRFYLAYRKSIELRLQFVSSFSPTCKCVLLVSSCSTCLHQKSSIFRNSEIPNRFEFTMIRGLFLFSICLVQLLRGNAYICNSTVSVNQSPVIGVLAQEIWNDGLPPNNSMIVAGYVKFLEMAGAQVVPVLLNQSDAYYDKLYGKLNGLLLPGGAPGDGYMKIAKIFWMKATNNNTDLSWRSPAERERNFFPIWGTCLGRFITGSSFELQISSHETFFPGTAETVSLF